MIFTVILFIALRFLSVWEFFGHFIRHSKCHVHHICIEIASKLHHIKFQKTAYTFLLFCGTIMH